MRYEKDKSLKAFKERERGGGRERGGERGGGRERGGEREGEGERGRTLFEFGISVNTKIAFHESRIMY